MFKRYKNLTIDKKIIDSFFSHVGKPDNAEDIGISDVWKRVFNIYDKTSSRNFYDRSSLDIKNLYENFFKNGLSDGACVGQSMNEFSGRYKIMKRENKRLSSLFLHLNPGVNNSYSRFSSKFVANKNHIHEITNYLSNIKISNNLLSGEPWMNIINKNQYLLEVVDHFYFYDVINRYFAHKTLKPIFIGEGSGILSNLLLNNLNDLKDAVFIDLGHFLLRQYIVNYEFESKIAKYIYAQDFSENKIINNDYTIINQDSFPEIPKNSLKKYFNLINQKTVTRVISYNHLDLRGHINYRNMLTDYFGEPKIRFESIIRPGYFIEIFE